MVGEFKNYRSFGAILQGFQLAVQCWSVCTWPARTLLQTLFRNSSATNPRASRITTPSRVPPSSDGWRWACSKNVLAEVTDLKQPLNTTGTTGISRPCAYASTSAKEANAPLLYRSANAWNVSCSRTGSYVMLFLGGNFILRDPALQPPHQMFAMTLQDDSHVSGAGDIQHDVRQPALYGGMEMYFRLLH